MKAKDILAESFSALSGNKARSSLTMLGIIIGICSVVVLVSVGQGATSSVTSSISSLGSNLLQVSPGASRSNGPVSGGFGSAKTLTEEDAKAIKKEIPNIASMAVVDSGRFQVTYKSNNTNTSIIGTQPEYALIRNVSVESGSFITLQAEQSGSKVAVIGPTVRDDLFGAGVNPIGSFIKINKIQFKVIGLTVSKGGSGFLNADDTIYIPYSTSTRFLSGNINSVTEIDIQAQDSNSVSGVQQELTTLLLARHKISDPTSADFRILNQADLVSSLSSITTTLTVLLGAIAGISLFVGGIGIMNMMLTSVTERTREIGLRKAIGAKRIDISIQFLTEAVILTFIGGLIGIMLGWGISTAITKLGIITTSITLQSIILAFGVSTLVGIVFGYYPAQRAAKLKPIEALKYE